MRSFDRFFPSQDYLPTKRQGFGNLIALPLQKIPRDQRNSVFLDAQMNVKADQRAFLAGVRRLSLQELHSLVRGALVAPKAGDNEADVSLETDRVLIDKEASPISFKGRVVQYAGRLHRESEGKADVRIHDYLDASSPVMLKMYRKRRKQYEAMGYVIEKVPRRPDRSPVLR